MAKTKWSEYRYTHPGTPEEIVRRDMPPMVRAIVDGKLEEYLDKLLDRKRGK